jgi:hypothetical protein
MSGQRGGKIKKKLIEMSRYQMKLYTLCDDTNNNKIQIEQPLL